MPDAVPPPSDGATPAPATAGKRRGESRTRHLVARVVVSTLVVLAMTTGLSVVFIYRHLNDNLTVVDVSDLLSNRPDKVDSGPQEPLNILVMGSDSREGEGNNIDGLTGDGERSDTTIMMHLSANREFAYGVSIPRDSLVDRPECKGENGDQVPGATDVMWNEAFSIGGPACTIQQFEQTTGVFIDNYVVLDFQGFQDMVDAIDGVEVCIPEDIDDPTHGINIPAGTREIEGKEALNYVRARYTLGDGSDIGRIKRQQAFIAAMASKVVSGGTLARFDRLVGFLNAATSSLQTDLKSVLDIGRVGVGFQNIGLDNIKFVTVPFQYSESQPGRVEFLPEADELWERVSADEPLTRRLQSGVITAGDDVENGDTEGGGSASGSESPSPSTSPSTEPPDESESESSAEREAAGLCA